MNKLVDKIYGCLLGGMIGDAFGAPGEGLTYREIQKKYGTDGLTTFEGMGTDDTAIRNQLIGTILKCEGYPNVDAFAQSFINSRDSNYSLWYTPVRNSYHKFSEGLSLPAYAGWGNMQSSSTAMAISPLGIINAGNPRQAVLETQEIASLIHNGPTGFCKDAACSIAAAVAACFSPSANIDSIIASATEFLLPVSSRELIDLIEKALNMASNLGNYESFREAYYEECLREVLADSRETIPATLAILHLSKGDPSKAIPWAANFGRDADTIGTMVGGIVGAMCGISGLPQEWVDKATQTHSAEADYSGDKYPSRKADTDLPTFDYAEISEQFESIIKDRQAELSNISGNLRKLNADL